jgi:hypothetical protein
MKTESAAMSRRHPHNGGKIDKRHDLKRTFQTKSHPEKTTAACKGRREVMRRVRAKEKTLQNHVIEKAREGVSVAR